MLTDDGFVVLMSRSAIRLRWQRQALEPIFQSKQGRAPLESCTGSLVDRGGQAYMAHKCGFTFSVLCKLFLDSGFKGVYGGRRPQDFDLIVALKAAKSESEMDARLRGHERTSN